MKPFRSIFTIPGTLLLAVCFCHAADPLQQVKSLGDKAYKKSILQKIEKLIEAKYVMAEKARIYADEFKKKVATGAYAAIIDAKEFAVKITADLQAITHDKHVSLRKIETSDIGEKAEGALHHSVRLSRLRQKENTGFQKLEWINGHIGYLDIRRFWAIEESRDMIHAAMKFLENADAIIIDVRENGGGSGTHLSSYFLPYPTQLTSWHYREQNYTEEFWTSKEMEGKPLTDVPLFLLVGKNTFSAAEIFAYDLQVWKRAVLIGEPTKGGAHSIDLFKINDQFEINISTSRAETRSTSTHYEQFQGIRVNLSHLFLNMTLFPYANPRPHRIQFMENLTWQPQVQKRTKRPIMRNVKIAWLRRQPARTFVHPEEDVMTRSTHAKTPFSASGGPARKNRNEKASSMRHLRIAVLAVFIMLSCVSVVAAKKPPADEKVVIAKTIRDNISWALTKDRPLAEGTMAHDERLLIISPDSAEITVGWEQFVKGFDFWMDPRFKATKSEIRDMRIDLSPSGVTAWWSCILDDLGEWDGKPIGWRDTRWTGVMEKRSGKWLIVQMHFSFASDKVAAEVKAKLTAPDIPAETIIKNK